MKHLLLSCETILPDDYPVYPYFVYIADMKFIKCPIHSIVGIWKKKFGLKEIRKCDIFGHKHAKIGDELTTI